MRTCTKCREEFPAIPDFFYRQARGRGGLSSWCKSCRNSNSKKNYDKNPEARVAQTTAWQQANREKARRYSRRYSSKNPGKDAVRTKRWREEHPEEHKAHVKAWQQRNPEKVVAYSNRRRAKKIGNGTEPYTLDDLFSAYGTDCYLCGEPVDLSAPRKTGAPGWERGLHIEHVIAITDGGPDTLGNVRPSHGKCNLRKR